MNKGKKFLKILVVGVVCLLLLGLVVMSLWNWLVPVLFSGPEITFWQALGLFLLAKLLFGGWGGRHGGHAWKEKYAAKLSSMSPEDRIRFKEKMKEKWCSPARKEPPRPDSNV